MRRFAFSAVLLSMGCLGFAQIHVGLSSDFQDGTLQGWGGPNCSIQLNGGPLGSGDGYAHTTADGSGQGGRLAMFNTSQWIGDFESAGVTRIKAMFRNFNSVQLEMRLVLFDGLTTARWTSATPAVLAPNSGWTTATFEISESTMVRVLGTSSYASMIHNVNRVMLRHDAGNPSSGGTSIVGQMGIDNIQAVPEPATTAALGVGLAVLVRRRKRA